MTKKIRIGVLFGGKSAEHEISLLSAKNVIEAMDKNKYEIILIGIDKNGEWHLRDALQFLEHHENPKRIHLQGKKDKVALVAKEDGQQLVSLKSPSFSESLDVIFPILHGPYGEDGTVQGLLKLANIPFVGAGVLSSAMCMDKDVMKRLLRDAALPIPKFLTLHSHRVHALDYETIKQDLGHPFFIKPANLGSSVGVHKVRDDVQFRGAVSDAFKYDHKILAEEFIPGREIECSVLGNEDPIASLPGEVIPTHDFYSYEAKYIDENGASLKFPADLSHELQTRVQTLAIEAYRTLCCEGMARVDFFLKESGEVVINELNTIPGFTHISMYP
ncbi:MAG: D-alanine--D-alanine ligase, partial [Anaerolineae bacterium]